MVYDFVVGIGNLRPRAENGLSVAEMKLADEPSAPKSVEASDNAGAPSSPEFLLYVIFTESSIFWEGCANIAVTRSP